MGFYGQQKCESCGKLDEPWDASLWAECESCSEIVCPSCEFKRTWDGEEERSRCICTTCEQADRNEANMEKL